MANTQRKKFKGPVTARPRTEKAEIAAAITAGKSEVVERVTDTLTSMFNRKQISQRQYAAGDRYRMAFEMLSGSPGGSMDFDRARGGSGRPSQGPALQYAMAADIVNDVKLKLLYPKDYAVIHRVCVIGLTIEQAARQLYDERFDGDWPPYQREAGHKFRSGLDGLADRWWPDSKTKTDPRTGEEVRPMRRFMTERAEPSDVIAVAPSSKVAHATRDKVYRGPQRKERV